MCKGENGLYYTFLNYNELIMPLNYSVIRMRHWPISYSQVFKTPKKLKHSYMDQHILHMWPALGKRTLTLLRLNGQKNGLQTDNKRLGKPFKRFDIKRERFGKQFERIGGTVRTDANTHSNGLPNRSNLLQNRSNGHQNRSNGLQNRSNGLPIRSNGLQIRLKSASLL